MNIWMLVTAGLLIALLVIFLYNKPWKKKNKYPEGHFIGVGLALGIPLGVAMGNIAIGPAIGLALGIAMEHNAKKQGKIRQMTKKEREQKTRVLYALLVLGIVVFLLFLAGYLWQ